jgi:hypothetical protein
MAVPDLPGALRFLLAINVKHNLGDLSPASASSTRRYVTRWDMSYPVRNGSSGAFSAMGSGWVIRKS